MGHFCDQLCKQFRLNILQTVDYKLLIIKSEGTYPIPFHKVIPCQSYHFHNTSFLTGSLYLLITFSTEGARGHMCRSTFLVNNKVV